MTDLHKPDNKGADKWQKIAEESEDQANDEGVEKAQLEFPTRQKLEDQLTIMERQLDECKQQTARAQAELENVRRRAERDVSNAHKYGVEQLINALLPVVDSLVRGLESSDDSDPKIKALHSGMQLILDLLHKTLMKFGVEIIDPAPGDNFDPRSHEAMGVQAQPDTKPNTIVKVLQKGYQLHGRVLRAAMVMVAA